MLLVDVFWHSIAIPLAVFAYIGIELVTVTAFEAKNPADLRWPARNIAYVILIIYAVTIGGISANVEWFDMNLPEFYSQPLISTIGVANSTLGHTPIINQTKPLLGTSFAPLIATLEAGSSYIQVTTVLLAFLVYSALSCANTNLYVASRTLYGLTRDLDLASNNWFDSFFAHLNIVTVKWRVPLWSLIASMALVSSWLPFVKLGLGQQDVSSKTLSSLYRV
jgi:amino acid transporter